MKLTVEDSERDSTGAYIDRSYEADLDEAFLLLEEFLESKDSLYFRSESFCLEFKYLTDTSFEVEIYDCRDGFWAISEVGILAAREITEMVFEDKKFGENIPTTNVMWGAYGGGEFSSKPAI